MLEKIINIETNLSDYRNKIRIINKKERFSINKFAYKI